ncbi:CPBP family glutamic-type intramembrane protease [Mesorhizobium sp. M0040]|uniref:CPBP family glutamic-type intramembrane protease n=1 Tax=Mesorhizobium sp. M0040 TaxID=2956855 RepID=UPI00333E018E
MSEAIIPNSRAAILERRSAGALTWSGPALMLFARSAFAVAAQGLVAAVYAAHGSATPWRDAGAWLPVYGSLIDAGCLGLLWCLARREGITLLDLVGFDRNRLGRDLLLDVALILPSLVFIYVGITASSLLVYGNPDAPQIYGPLPLLPALYGVLIFPLVWGITEQTTYNGYLLPRFQVLSGSTGFAVAVVAFSWSFQHAVMPLTFDPHFMLYRLLAPIAHSTFITLVYLRVRRILPLATAHWLMDGASVFIGILWPLLR